MPDIILQDGILQDSVTQDNEIQNSTTQNNTARNSVVQDNVVRKGMVRVSVAQNGIAQNSAAQNSVVVNNENTHLSENTNIYECIRIENKLCTLVNDFFRYTLQAYNSGRITRKQYIELVSRKARYLNLITNYSNMKKKA